MNISLVFPPFYLEPMYNLPPLGLVSIATVLKGFHHKTTITDFPLAIRRKSIGLGKRIYEDCAAYILDQDPDMVAFSVQCTTYPAAVQIAKNIKGSKRDVRIVFGGHNASFVDERTLRAFSWIDAIVRGEGEITFRDLVEAYESGSGQENIPGITYRDGNGIFRNQDRELIRDLDDLPLADYGFVARFSEYRDVCRIPRSIAILEVGRGCPHSCVYCSQALMWRRRTRTFSVDRLISEMRHLRDAFGAECFLLAYDQFTAKRSFVEEFCRKVIEANLSRIPWYCISRLDSVDGPLLEVMREAGCESMCYGIDSGSGKTLAFIRKNIDHDILYDRVQETTAQGIVPTLSFVIGFPEEGITDIDETLTLALRTGILGNVNALVQMATVLPGTDLHSGYADRLVKGVDTYFSLGLEFDGGRRLKSDEELIDSDPILFSSFYNLPCPGLSPEELNLIAGYFHLIVSFYPASFLLLSVECGQGVSNLYLEWLDWLKERLGRSEPKLLPQDCYQHFGNFANTKLEQLGGGTRPHIVDIVRYETFAIEAGKFDASDTHFHIDMAGIGEFKPARNRKVILAQFTFHLPDLIFDLKSGVLGGVYPESSTFLAFKQERDRLHVVEINDFGVDFLKLCDGTKTLESISRELYGRYGRDVNASEFYTLCVEAARTLGRMNLLKARQSDDDRERR